MNRRRPAPPTVPTPTRYQRFWKRVRLVFAPEPDPPPKPKAKPRNRDRVTFDYIQPEQIPVLVAAGKTARDRAMLSVLSYLGLRCNELRMLDEADVRWETDELVVRHAKGGKQRLLPLDPVKEHLQAWLGERGDVSDNALFLTRVGTRISNRHVRSLVKAYGVKARVGENIPQGLHPHALRHTVATTMLKAGVDLRVIQEFLGHSSPSVTAFYANVDLGQKRAAVDTMRRAFALTDSDAAAAAKAAA